MLRRLLIFLILFAGVSIAGGIYKWVDERGITVFSETPPSGKTVQQVKLPPQPPKSVALPAGAEGGQGTEAILPELPDPLPPALPEGNQGSEDNRRIYVTAMMEGAKQGDALTQSILGLMYEKGIGVYKNEAEAVKWYRKAAEQDNATALSILGLMYADGRGVTKDNAKAMELFGKLVEKKYASMLSQDDPVLMNLRIFKDESKVADMYREQAESGSTIAQSHLGDFYTKGFGVTKDDAEAFKWYSKAAEQGFGAAQYNLGFMYAKGRGVAKDEAEAMKWYRKAAEHEAATLEAMIRVNYEFGPF